MHIVMKSSFFYKHYRRYVEEQRAARSTSMLDFEKCFCYTEQNNALEVGVRAVRLRSADIYYPELRLLQSDGLFFLRFISFVALRLQRCLFVIQ